MRTWREVRNFASQKYRLTPARPTFHTATVATHGADVTRCTGHALFTLAAESHVWVDLKRTLGGSGGQNRTGDDV